MIITIPDMPERRIGLRTEAHVAQGSFTQRIRLAAQSILDRILGSGAADAAVR
jgi:hypothetical protein